MKVAIDEVIRTCRSILLARGLNEQEAQWIAEDYLDAELAGKRSHGLAAFGMVVKDCETRGHATVSRENGPVAFIEGNGDIGHLVVRQALEWAVSPLSQFGLAFIGIANIKRFATPGTVARLAAAKGWLSVVLEYGGQAFMVPEGGSEPIISTNPIGIGIPASETPFILDMACSQRAFYYVGLAKKLGQRIPRDWAVDSSGAPTDDPSEVRAVRPFGGYKGYGLALAIEVLTGPLLGVPVGLAGRLDRRGALLMFMKPGLFGIESDHFIRDTDALFAEVRASRPTIVDRPVQIPGERANQLREAALERGSLDVEDPIWHAILALQEDLAVQQEG